MICRKRRTWEMWFFFSLRTAPLLCLQHSLSDFSLTIRALWWAELNDFDDVCALFVRIVIFEFSQVIDNLRFGGFVTRIVIVVVVRQTFTCSCVFVWITRSYVAAYIYNGTGGPSCNWKISHCQNYVLFFCSSSIKKIKNKNLLGVINCREITFDEKVERKSVVDEDAKPSPSYGQRRIQEKRGDRPREKRWKSERKKEKKSTAVHPHDSSTSRVAVAGSPWETRLAADVWTATSLLHVVHVVLVLAAGLGNAYNLITASATAKASGDTE